MTPHKDVAAVILKNRGTVDMQSTREDRTIDLLAGWNRALAVFEAGDRTTKVCALNVMAVIVSKIPIPAVQDLLEDRLSDCMTVIDLTADERATIRHFRGISAEADTPSLKV